MSATADNDTVFEQLCHLITPFNTKGVALTRETDIAADLNIDSVAIMDFMMEVEDRFNIDISLNLLSDISNLGDLTSLVERKLAEGR